MNRRLQSQHLKESEKIGVAQMSQISFNENANDDDELSIAMVISWNRSGLDEKP